MDDEFAKTGMNAAAGASGLSNQAGLIAGSGFVNDIHIRSTAMELAYRFSKTGEPFPEMMGRARLIYAFLTDKPVS